MNISSSREVFRWQPAACLRVSGPDAAEFLQGQFTNDLRKATSENAVYGLWLTLKGKVIADSFILHRPAANEYRVVSYASPAAVIRERLESHVIADDVTIEDQTAAVAGLTTAPEVATGPAASAFRERGGVLFRGRRSRGERTEWVGPRDAIAAAVLGLGELHEVDATEMERRRIADGIPAIPADVGPGDLPNEAGLEADAISYTKGCYLGQEVMARLKSMGQVRRRLLRVQADGLAVPPLPAALHAGDKPVGELRSAVLTFDGRSVIGLAMVSLLNVRPETPLTIAPGAGAPFRFIDQP